MSKVRPVRPRSKDAKKQTKGEAHRRAGGLHPWRMKQPNPTKVTKINVADLSPAERERYGV